MADTNTPYQVKSTETDNAKIYVPGVVSDGLSYYLDIALTGISQSYSYTAVGGDDASDVLDALRDSINNDAVVNTIVTASTSLDDDLGYVLKLVSNVIDTNPMVITLPYENSGADERLRFDFFEPMAPNWATNADSFVVEPENDKKNAGWELIAGSKGERPALEYFNWFYNITTNWFNFIKKEVVPWIPTLKELPKVEYFNATVVGFNNIEDNNPILNDSPRGTYVFPCRREVIFSSATGAVQRVTYTIGETSKRLGTLSSDPLNIGPAIAEKNLAIAYCDIQGNLIDNGVFPDMPEFTSRDNNCSSLTTWQKGTEEINVGVQDMQWVMPFVVDGRICWRTPEGSNNWFEYTSVATLPSDWFMLVQSFNMTIDMITK